MEKSATTHHVHALCASSSWMMRSCVGCQIYMYLWFLCRLHKKFTIISTFELGHIHAPPVLFGVSPIMVFPPSDSYMNGWKNVDIVITYFYKLRDILHEMSCLFRTKYICWFKPSQLCSFTYRTKPKYKVPVVYNKGVTDDKCRQGGTSKQKSQFSLKLIDHCHPGDTYQRFDRSHQHWQSVSPGDL